MPTTKKKLQGTRSSLRFEPPRLDEAIYAAQGLATDVDGQTEIAAMLMGLPEAEVRSAILKAAAPAARSATQSAVPFRSGSNRSIVVVERRNPRFVMR
jgi:hypothetical protein